MKSLEFDQLVKEAFSEEIERASAGFNAQHDKYRKCPSPHRFVEVAVSGLKWDDRERQHIEQPCTSCMRTMQLQWEITCPSESTLEESLEEGFMFAAPLDSHLDQCKSCQLRLRRKVETAGVLSSAGNLAGALPSAEAARILIQESCPGDVQTRPRSAAVIGLAPLTRLVGLVRALRFTGPLAWAAVAAAAMITTLVLFTLPSAPVSNRIEKPAAHSERQVRLEPPSEPSRPVNTPTEDKRVLDAHIVSSLADLELRVRYELFLRGWDLGEDLNVHRSEGQVLLTGTASAAERAKAISEVFASFPDIHVAILAPDTSPPLQGTISSAIPAPAMHPPLLADALENAYASIELRQQFVKDMLTASDRVVAHAFAVNHLAQRYTDSEVTLLNDVSRLKLQEILVAHLRRLSDVNSRLDVLLHHLTVPAIPSYPQPPDWRVAASSILTSAQLEETALAALTVGTTTTHTDGSEAQVQFSKHHHAVRHLANDTIAILELTGLDVSNNKTAGEERRQ